MLITPSPQPTSSYGTMQPIQMRYGNRMNGLRDDFNPSGTYTLSPNPTDTATARQIGNPYQQSSVGTYQGLKVFKNPVTGKLFVYNQGSQDPDYGFVFYELFPVSTSTQTPESNPDCPCGDCKEVTEYLTYYLSEEQASPDDEPVEMIQDIITCSPNGDKPKLACQALLEQYQNGGSLKGLGRLSNDNSDTGTAITYTTDTEAGTFLPPSFVTVEKNSSNCTLWIVIAAIISLIIGAIAAYALMSRH